MENQRLIVTREFCAEMLARAEILRIGNCEVKFTYSDGKEVIGFIKSINKDKELHETRDERLFWFELEGGRSAGTGISRRVVKVRDLSKIDKYSNSLEGL